MNRQDQQAEYYQSHTRVDRSSHHYTSAGVTRTLTPMERWAREKATDQPWNTVAASKANSSGKECSSGRGTSSTRGQNGSVEEWTKWESVTGLDEKGILVVLVGIGIMRISTLVVPNVYSVMLASTCWSLLRYRVVLYQSARWRGEDSLSSSDGEDLCESDDGRCLG